MASLYNFSAGPAMLPPEVMAQAQEEFTNYRGTGVSVMELSHRSELFGEIIRTAEADLRRLMNIPSQYHVLFLQGGAHTQFAMVPLNLFRNRQRSDYLDTGIWSQKAIAEASRYGFVQVVASSQDRDYTYIPEIDPNRLDPQADYFHLTTNNTIYGTQVSLWPILPEVPVVADMSSNILSQPYQVEDFGIIYAGAQKNIGPAGLTLVIIREDLVGRAQAITPTMLNYQTHVEKVSLYNTPSTYAIYLAGLVFKWTLAQGGVDTMVRHNAEKAALLYQYLDASEAFRGMVDSAARSQMNVTFTLDNEALNQQFVAEAESAGLMALKGHRKVGGMRASLYNPMPLKGVEALVDFMAEFEKKRVRL